MSPTYEQIADNYNLWCEYVDPDGLTSKAEFEEMSLSEKIEFQIRCFGAEDFEEDL